MTPVVMVPLGDVLQAVSAALLFGEDAGLAAVGLVTDEELAGIELQEVVTLDVGAMHAAKVSKRAARLLDMAMHRIQEAGLGTVSLDAIGVHDFGRVAK